MSDTRASLRPDPDATGQSILEAAARTFMTRGFEGASMERIAVEARVGRRTLYNRFENKRALFDATVEHLWRRMPIEEATPGVERPSDPVQAMRALGLIVAAFWSSDMAAAFARMIIAESIRFPELGESFLDRGRNPARGKVVKFIRDLIASGCLKPHDPDVSAAQFIALITGPALWDRIVGQRRPFSKIDQEQLVGEAVKTFVSRYRS